MLALLIQSLENFSQTQKDVLIHDKTETERLKVKAEGQEKVAGWQSQLVKHATLELMVCIFQMPRDENRNVYWNLPSL